MAGVQEALAEAVGPPRGTALRRAALGRGHSSSPAVAVALVVSLLSSSSQAFAHSGSEPAVDGHLGPDPQDLRGRDLHRGHPGHHGRRPASWPSPSAWPRPPSCPSWRPRWLATPLSVLIDLIAAVPSIVVGLWGLLVLTPVFARHVEPFLKKIPVLEWFFHGPALGPSMLLAGVVLAVMILPTMVALSRTALSGVALTDREAARALGGTRWQVVGGPWSPGPAPGIEAAVILAMGRALGESIAVAMVIGNAYVIPHSLLSPGGHAGLGHHQHLRRGHLRARAVRGDRPGGDPARHHRAGERRGSAAAALAARPETEVPMSEVWCRRPADGATSRPRRPPGDDLIRATSARSLGRRHVAGRVAVGLCVVAVAISLAPLVALVAYTTSRGIHALSVDFFTQSPRRRASPGAGSPTPSWAA